MIICGCSNVRKQKEIRNVEHYITLDIYLDLGCLHKRKLTSPGPRYYVGIPDKGLNTYLTLRSRKKPKSKQKAKFSTTDVCLQSFFNT